MSNGTIFGLQPFEPKRVLVLPSEGGELTLYVLGGKAYPTKTNEVGSKPRRVVNVVHFEGWSAGFKNAKLRVPDERLVDAGSDFEYYPLEVVFRLVPRQGGGQTAEIVAVSYDECRTFYENELCTLPKEYDEADAQAG